MTSVYSCRINCYISSRFLLIYPQTATQLLKSFVQILTFVKPHIFCKPSCLMILCLNLIIHRRISQIYHFPSIMRLFYPASSYPHKNHSLLTPFILDAINSIDSSTFFLTVDYLGFTHVSLDLRPSLSRAESISLLKSCDCLIFLSSIESFGLPLLEAYENSIPIIAPFLEYSYELFGDSIYYFDFTSFSFSFPFAVSRLFSDKQSSTIKYPELAHSFSSMSSVSTHILSILSSH